EARSLSPPSRLRGDGEMRVFAAVIADLGLRRLQRRLLLRSLFGREAKGAVAHVNACWRTLGTAVVAQIARDTGGSYFLDDLWPTLLERAALTGLRAARCREVTSQPAAR